MLEMEWAGGCVNRRAGEISEGHRAREETTLLLTTYYLLLTGHRASEETPCAERGDKGKTLDASILCRGEGEWCKH